MLVLVAHCSSPDCYFHVLGWMSELDNSLFASFSYLFFFPEVLFVTSYPTGTAPTISFDFIHP